ncbi:isoaspartyl peptidase [Robbsia andropogonis]|uniref:Isoaspartyl peptidase n=1 Tax=Robbsia andropogonis TaxID=28092 RepID=A0A0F5K6B7_9BURK|nr:isoaspartyl peptidase/L-asparaginase [Robbsia andropogonis]KKB65062.1 isoaspartyl peptidase [Robbsia andropogonis]MCP1119130.1 isoaspartyl peptidase/L-asparaginase [Robbsia andropogonis]MCP1129019.1 isoaspartyl peptidase/L-asparaginase [Robbsia andropogonis]
MSTYFAGPSNARIPVIAIHGGAGTMSRALIREENTRAYHQALHDIVAGGQDVLARGGSAMDAVCHAVSLLEDCPLFNAGHGAVYTAAGTHELDAAVMDGATRAAGAVTGINHVRNPVLAARAVMTLTNHVLIGGASAEALAREAGLQMVEPAYFETAARLAQLRAAQAAKSGAVLDHDGAAALQQRPLDESKKFGTVGAVALDMHGHLAAATSTGGMTNKRVGRIGDSPQIGAGTFADDRQAAVSCTGHGESFIRTVAAHHVCMRMAYGGESLQQASEAVVHQVLKEIDGRGGLIAIDAQGNVSLPFNTEGMYRGYGRVGGTPSVAIFN